MSSINTRNSSAVYIIEDALTVQELDALRREIEFLLPPLLSTTASKIQKEHVDLNLTGAAIDLFEHAHIPPWSKARRDEDTYMAERFKINTACSQREKRVLQDLLFQSLPSKVKKVLSMSIHSSSSSSSSSSLSTLSPPPSSPSSNIYLFNEHYVVKRATSPLSFRWHRDGDEQLAAMMFAPPHPPSPDLAHTLTSSSSSSSEVSRSNSNRSSSTSTSRPAHPEHQQQHQHMTSPAATRRPVVLPRAAPQPPIYWSIWCPLDDVSVANGTLSFPAAATNSTAPFCSTKAPCNHSKSCNKNNGSSNDVTSNTNIYIVKPPVSAASTCGTLDGNTPGDIVHISEICPSSIASSSSSSSPTSDCKYCVYKGPTTKDIISKEGGVTKDDNGCVEEKKHLADEEDEHEEEQTKALPAYLLCGAATFNMTIPAGYAVLFASDMYHKSGPNTSDTDRRVFYAQYSIDEIIGVSTSVNYTTVPSTSKAGKECSADDIEDSISYTSSNKRVRHSESNSKQQQQQQQQGLAEEEEEEEQEEEEEEEEEEDEGDVQPQQSMSQLQQEKKKKKKRMRQSHEEQLVPVLPQGARDMHDIYNTKRCADGTHNSNTALQTFLPHHPLSLGILCRV